jgi:hypothetical protein
LVEPPELRGRLTADLVLLLLQLVLRHLQHAVGEPLGLLDLPLDRLLDRLVLGLRLAPRGLLGLADGPLARLGPGVHLRHRPLVFQPQLPPQRLEPLADRPQRFFERLVRLLRRRLMNPVELGLGGRALGGEGHQVVQRRPLHVAPVGAGVGRGTRRLRGRLARQLRFRRVVLYRRLVLHGRHEQLRCWRRGWRRRVTGRHLHVICNPGGPG